MSPSVAGRCRRLVWVFFFSRVLTGRRSRGEGAAGEVRERERDANGRGAQVPGKPRGRAGPRRRGARLCPPPPSPPEPGRAPLPSPVLSRSRVSVFPLKRCCFWTTHSKSEIGFVFSVLAPSAFFSFSLCKSSPDHIIAANTYERMVSFIFKKVTCFLFSR